MGGKLEKWKAFLKDWDEVFRHRAGRRDCSEVDAYDVVEMLRDAVQEVERLQGKWDEADERCPQCGTGNPKIKELKDKISILKESRLRIKSYTRPAFHIAPEDD